METLGCPEKITCRVESIVYKATDTLTDDLCINFKGKRSYIESQVLLHV